MKKLLSLALCAFSLSAFAAGASACSSEQPTAEKYPVYLIIGQSNASGNGRIEHLPESFIGRTFDGVDIYCGGTSNGAVYGELLTVNTVTGQGSVGVNRFGVEVGIANIFNEKGYEAGLIKCGFDGSSINLNNTGMGSWWTVENDIPPAVKRCYFTFLSEVETALNAFRKKGFDPEIKGAVWIQGESNPEDASYESDLDALIARIRSDLNVPDLFFVAGTISYVKPGVYKENCAANVAIRKLANKNNCDFVESGAFATNPNDAYHWTGSELLNIGDLFGLKLYNKCANK